MQIKEVMFDGLPATEIATECWRMIVISQFGPRIAFLGRGGEEENLLYWDQSRPPREEWHLRGGHRVWLTRPYADESEDTYLSDNEPCRVEKLENGLRVTAPPHPMTKLERGMEIRVQDENTFLVTNFIRNTGDFIYSGGVWSPTCICPDGCEIHIPLGEPDSTWDLVKIVIPRKFAGNTVLIQDPQVTCTEEEMVICPQGIVTKRCVCAPQGAIAAYWPNKKIRLTKKVSYVRDGRYPLDGCNIAAFVGASNWMAEIETYGIERSLRPGETMGHEEQWILEG